MYILPPKCFEILEISCLSTHEYILTEKAWDEFGDLLRISALIHILIFCFIKYIEYQIYNGNFYLY